MQLILLFGSNHGVHWKLLYQLEYLMGTGLKSMSMRSVAEELSHNQWVEDQVFIEVIFLSVVRNRIVTVLV